MQIGLRGSLPEGMMRKSKFTEAQICFSAAAFANTGES